MPELSHDGQLTDLESSLIRSHEANAAIIAASLDKNTAAVTKLAERIVEIGERVTKLAYGGFVLIVLVLLFTIASLADQRGVDVTRAADATQTVISATSTGE